MNSPIEAVETDHNFDGDKNILIDALYEMGYGEDDNLANTLMARNVIDFSWADYTSDVIDELIEHYGEEVLCGGLVLAVAREGLEIELENANGQSWRSLRWETLKKYIPYIILDEVESLGLNVANGQNLKAYTNLSKHLNQVKRNLLIDYGGDFGYHMPDVDIIIYHPDTCKVLAVVSGQVTLQRIDHTIKLAQDEVTKHIKAYFIDSSEERINQTVKLLQDEGIEHIKAYFIDSSEEGTLDDNNYLAWDRAFIESSLDRNYLNTEDNEKAKLFERFIADLTEVLRSD
jgi:type II restriction enzyme